MSYDRYSKFRVNGSIRPVPFIEIPKSPDDNYTYYREGETRLDILSYQYYNDPNYDWLIMQANPQYGSLEFNIPDGARLRIPYPLDTVIARYNADVDRYITLYGF
jgi:hypothetical protein